MDDKTESQGVASCSFQLLGDCRKCTDGPHAAECDSGEFKQENIPVLKQESDDVRAVLCSLLYS